VEFAVARQSEEVAEVVVVVAVQEDRVEVKVDASLAFVPDRPKTGRVQSLDRSS